jgi:Flp pilus assembly protein CpaB
MKRRNWLWFVASALLAVLAGVLAMVLLRDQGPVEEAVPKQAVVVAINPIAANTVVRVDYVELVEKDVDAVPSGAFVAVKDLVDRDAVALRDIGIGEILLAQDFYIPGEGESGIPDDKIAVALPAEDILSKWGAILPGDHVDVLITMDVILESPMYPADVRTQEELSLYAAERDQSMDDVSVLTLQNLEVFQIIEEPLPEGQEQNEEQPTYRNRALILLAEPQDAVVLRYLLDVVGSDGNGGNVTLAKRSPDNEALFNVQPVNINYLMLRYGVVLPQPLE